MSKVDVPVLVVGAGPVGLLGGLLLGRRNVRTMIVEKHLRRLDAPKAHALNPRSLEICAAAGLPMQRLHDMATPSAEGAHVRMVASLTGAEIGVLPYERQDNAVRDLTPWPLINVEQPRVEALLEETVGALDEVEIRRGVEWLRCEQRSGVVVSTLRDRRTGEEIEVRSRYLIAADGAGSAVRDAIGVALEGPADLQRTMMIHFEADLSAIVARKPAILYFLFGPRANGALIAYDIRKTWVLMHPYPPDRMQPEDFTEDVCRALVGEAIGAEVPDLVIRGARPWVMSAQVATRYRVGNVYLAGDAAHRFPPTGGLGLNTGIGDVDNLCWKIAAVEQGWAGKDILDSYDAERRVVARVNREQSMNNAMRMLVLFDALGYGAEQTVDPATFAARLADRQARRVIDDAVAQQREHFDSLRLQLGFVYGCDEATDAALPIDRFVPRAVAGARLPHVALRDARSTLDLIGQNGLTLLTGPQYEAWGTALASSAAPVDLLAEDRDFATASGDWAAGMGLGEDGALLVRPDGHILAVAADATQAGHVARSLAGFLGRGESAVVGAA